MDYIREQLKHLKSNKKEYELITQAEPSETAAAHAIYRRITNPGNQSTADGIVAINPSLPAVADSSQQRESKIDDLLPRFGPIYRQDKDPMDNFKKKAWRRVKYNSIGGDGGVVKEKIVAAIRGIEEEARATYDWDIAGAPSEFRMMMIKDGCFFLHLAFIILGKSQVELGTYLKEDTVLGRNISEKDIKQWMEAMFLVGNQIPLVVLKILIKQKYFQDIIADQGTRDLPAFNLRRKALFNMIASLDQNAHFRRTNEIFEPSDLLTGLKNLVLGAAPMDDKFGKYEVSPFDLEANTEESTDDRERNFASATELEKSGIGIKKLETGGPRSIHFTRFYWSASLHLPTLRVDEDTEMVFRTLKSYEMSTKQLGKHNHEVQTYITFMSDLIQTPQDLSLLQKKRIIEGSPDHADKLLGILTRLNSKDATLTYKFRNIRRQIRDFSSPLVRYQKIINLVVFLTFVQTLFALLAYVRPP